MDILLGLLEPREGEILADGVNVKEHYRKWLKNIGYIPQMIFMLDDTIRKKCDYDVGAASTMVMLAAVEKGLSTCPIGNFDAAKLTDLMKLPVNLQPELVIAVGYPAQESFVVPMEDTVRYTQDDSGNFLVPKWNAEDILVFDK